MEHCKPHTRMTTVSRRQGQFTHKCNRAEVAEKTRPFATAFGTGRSQNRAGGEVEESRASQAEVRTAQAAVRTARPGERGHRRAAPAPPRARKAPGRQVSEGKPSKATRTESPRGNRAAGHKDTKARGSARQLFSRAKLRSARSRARGARAARAPAHSFSDPRRLVLDPGSSARARARPAKALSG